MEEKVLETKDKMKYTNKYEKRNVDIMRFRGRKLCFSDCAGGKEKYLMTMPCCSWKENQNSGMV